MILRKVVNSTDYCNASKVYVDLVGGLVIAGSYYVVLVAWFQTTRTLLYPCAANSQSVQLVHSA